MCMIKLKNLILENIDDPHSEESELLRKRIRDAAETQRKVPESTMLKCQRIIQQAHGSNVLVNAIEHVGDLSHRAQKENAILNVKEKVEMMLQYWDSSRWSLETEIKNGTLDNCKYSYFKSNPNLKQIFDNRYSDRKLFISKWNSVNDDVELLELLNHANTTMKTALNLYVTAHKKHNNPITKLGILGKNAAILLGSLEYDKLHQCLLEIIEWVNQYNSISDETLKWKMFSSNH